VNLVVIRLKLIRDAKMNKLAWLFVLPLFPLTPAVGEDTLRDRLISVERFGVQSHEGTLAVTLHAYTKQQYDVNLADLNQYEVDRKSHDAERAEARRRQREVRDRFMRDRSLEVIQHMKDENSEGPGVLNVSAFASRIKLHAKAALGEDYISLVPHGSPGTELIIPLSRIGRVVFKSDPARPATKEPSPDPGSNG
jgi:hypothetical protein